MHELGLARDLLKDALKMKNGEAPKKLVIVIGKAAGIEEDFLLHSFKDHLFPEFGLEDVEIEIEYEDPKLQCDDCGEIIDEGAELAMTCPKCGSFNLQVISGQRVYVKEVV